MDRSEPKNTRASFNEDNGNNKDGEARTCINPKENAEIKEKPKVVCRWFFKKTVDDKVKRERYINKH